MPYRTAAVAIKRVVNETPSAELLTCFFLDLASLAVRDFGKEPRERETLANQHRIGSNHDQQRHSQSPEQVTAHGVKLIV